jgi:hypothetical protein
MVLIGATLGSSAQAHIASNGFLVAEVSGEDIKGSIELAVRDVELAIGVDRNHDGNITWRELRASAPQLRQYVAERLHLAAQGRACSVSFQALQVNDRVDGSYSWLPWTAHCSGPIRQLSVSYALMQDIDPSHRGLLTLKAGSVVQTAVLGGAAGRLNFDVAKASRWRTFTEYLQAGIWHIWGGIDHLLFLLSLLLPAVLLRQHGHWRALPSARPAFLSILKVVTAFTLAHSITLSLAAFDVVRLPSRLTESVIAASIIIAALNNVFPLVTEARARIAFGFGLLHGFGFASVLADMGLPNGARLLSLVAFNLGIECGQLAVVLLVMPLIYSVRRATLYQRAVLPLGSAAIALLATVWLMQRALGP